MVQNDKNKSVPKKYIGIVKVGNNADGTANCVKYRFNDLLKFTAFLDTKWNGWKWFNVYSNRGENRRLQVANFTNKKRPDNHTV